MAATATESKTREITYYKTVGTAAGPQLKLTDASTKPIHKALDVLAIHAKNAKDFPCAPDLYKRLRAYLDNPQSPLPEDRPPPALPPGAGKNSVG